MYCLPQRLKSTFFEIFSCGLFSAFLFLCHNELKVRSKKYYKRRWFYPLRQTVHCPAKMVFFPSFSSLCSMLPLRRLCIIVLFLCEENNNRFRFGRWWSLFHCGVGDPHYYTFNFTIGAVITIR